MYGEEFQLTVDAEVCACVCVSVFACVWVYLCLHLNLASQGQTGIVAGDETGWKPLHIKHDSLEADFMFAPLSTKP